MKKAIIVVVAVVLLAGCEGSRIMYDGKERPIDEVEEIIGDKLEVENPGMDLDVNITEDLDDDNKIKRKKRR